VLQVFTNNDGNGVNVAHIIWPYKAAIDSLLQLELRFGLHMNLRAYGFCRIREAVVVTTPPRRSPPRLTPLPPPVELSEPICCSTPCTSIPSPSPVAADNTVSDAKDMSETAKQQQRRSLRHRIVHESCSADSDNIVPSGDESERVSRVTRARRNKPVPGMSVDEILPVAVRSKSATTGVEATAGDRDRLSSVASTSDVIQSTQGTSTTIAKVQQPTTIVHEQSDENGITVSESAWSDYHDSFKIVCTLL
jgi:hypothetical protein